MRSEKEHAGVEIRRLKACIGDLLCVSAIPAISRGLQPPHVIGSLLEVLLGTLRLDLAYAEFSIDGTARPITLARFSPEQTCGELPLNFRAAADAWLAEQSQISPCVVKAKCADESFSLALISLGLSAEIGWLLVCARRDDFPTQTERLILRVAANQTVMSLQQAQLLSDQTQVSRELDRKVRQRTQDLQAANLELRNALRQVDALRDALQRENLVLREQTATARGGLAPWQLRRAEALMTESLGGPVPLGQLAHECGLSVRHFARAFRQSTGVPPHRWLLDRRVERAKELLPNSLLSLSDVALACGFGDQSHFTRVFSAAVRLSPGLWRRLQSVPSPPEARSPKQVGKRTQRQRTPAKTRQGDSGTPMHRPSAVPPSGAQ